MPEAVRDGLESHSEEQPIQDVSVLQPASARGAVVDNQFPRILEPTGPGDDVRVLLCSTVGRVREPVRLRILPWRFKRNVADD